MAALPLPTRISQSSAGTKKYRIIKAQFGNGYQQRGKDGINNKMASWNVLWENVTETEMDTIVAALDATNGTTNLTWTPPDEATDKKWIVSGYNINPLSGSIFTVTASLEQIFDLV